MSVAASRAEFAFFGELIVRLSSASVPIAHARALDVYAGGAEANVAVGLASLGHATRMISCVPDNDLGRLAVASLMAAGVDCSGVSRAAGRMALYFLSVGNGVRAPDVLYDRAGSAFARASAADFDFDRLLDGATHLHLSGITPALGPRSAELAIAAAQAAKARGMTVIFDGNYRAQLWRSWESDPRAILGTLVGLTDILFGNHRDIALLLGREFPGDDAARRREAAEAAFDAFPILKLIAATDRVVEDVSRHRLTARVDSPEGSAETAPMIVADIADRIGAGDAFAAGVLHAMLTSPGDLETIARTGLALSALKHSLPGDASLFRQEDLESVLRGELDVRR